MILPPPPKWDKANDGLENALQWTAKFERSLLPPNTLIPQNGQIWEAVRDCEANFIAFIPSAVLPGGRARLPQGERVRVHSHDPESVCVCFQPVRYEETGRAIVPDEIRNRAGYQYYWLSLRIARTLCCLHEEPGYFHELFAHVADLD